MRLLELYRVLPINHDFLNLKEAADTMISNSEIFISKLSMIKVTQEQPGDVYTKKGITELEENKGSKENIHEGDFKTIQLCLQEYPFNLSKDKKNLRVIIPFWNWQDISNCIKNYSPTSTKENTSGTKHYVCNTANYESIIIITRFIVYKSVSGFCWEFYYLVLTPLFNSNLQ